MKNNNINHTFVVLANGRNLNYLEESIVSIINQTAKSHVLISTCKKTPKVLDVAQRYNIPIHVNMSGDNSIASNWSHAYSLAKTKYVTLAHDDDLYSPLYVEYSLKRAMQYSDTILTFCDYSDLVNGKIHQNSFAPLVKRVFSKVFGYPKGIFYSNNRKKTLVTIGNMITIPTVMLNKDQIGPFLFNSSFHHAIDWEAVVRLSNYDGKFIFINHCLMQRRIHSDSYTTLNSRQMIRQEEIIKILEIIWGSNVAKFISKLHHLKK